MFMGEYNHTVDAKGRLIVPSKFREQLGDEFVITKGLDNCLFVYDNSEWTALEEKLRALPITNTAGRKFSRFLLGSAATCEVDKQGRILLPAVLREFAGIEKDAVLVGVGSRIEVWNKDKWMQANTFDDMEEIAEHMERLGYLMEEHGFVHKSVLLYETVGSLNIKPGGIYVDGTLGGGGHAYEVCKRLGGGRLIGIDQDADAIRAAGERLAPFKDKVTIVRSNYQNIENVLKELNIEKVDGIYLDLGVSSYQLDTASRGFTYREDAPLDMRMDQRNPTTAADIVNGYSEMELFHIIRDYGEDNFAKNIAKHIVKARAEKPVETTGELSEIIKAAIPAKVRATGGHPAKRTFQAIRIELNHELDVLENSIDTMIRLLNPEGRLSIITFHSLEDRIVKTRFRTNENPCICPPDFPVCVCGRKSMGKVITRKPILPSKEELEENSRSKSAKLRVFERAEKEE